MTTTDTRLTDEELAEVAVQHVCDNADMSGDPDRAEEPACVECGQRWPCDAARLLTEFQQLRQVREAAREAVRILSGGRQGYVGDHYIREVQVKQATVDRLRAALHPEESPR